MQLWRLGAPTGNLGRFAALAAAAALGFAGATLLHGATTPPRAEACAATTLDRAALDLALDAALEPLAERLEQLAGTPFAVAATRSEQDASPPASVDPPTDLAAPAADDARGSLAALDERLAAAAALVAELDRLAGRLAAAIATAPSTDPLEEQLRRVERPKDLAALIDAYDEISCNGRAIAANYALLGPRSVAERFGVPDSVEAANGKSWWYWRIDADRSLGVAFANGLVCDLCTP